MWHTPSFRSAERVGLHRTTPGAGRQDPDRLISSDIDMDVLIRDVPEHVVAAVDANARKLGLSRTEYLRRRLVQEVTRTGRPVTTGDLAAFAGSFSDLEDPDVMGRAWR